MDDREHSGAGQSQAGGLSMADVMALPDQQCQLVTWMMKRDPCDITEIATFLEEDEGTALVIVTDLVQQGFVVKVEPGEYYQAMPATRRRRPGGRDLWRALDDLVGD